MRYRYVIFDIDGTLIDSTEAIDLGLREMAREVLGRPLTDAEAERGKGLSAPRALEAMGMAPSEQNVQLWMTRMFDHWDDVDLYQGIMPMLDALRGRGCTLGLVTADTAYEIRNGFARFGLMGRFAATVTADDTKNNKPDAEPLLHCLDLLGARPEEALYVGDGRSDAECAAAAGVDFALACWRKRPLREPVRARAYCPTPWHVVELAELEAPTAEREPWLAWCRELQAIGQIGEFYTTDVFDLERFQRIRQMADECMSRLSGLPLRRIEDLFDDGECYQTPKMDSRAAVFDEEGRICLVREYGAWSMPGGWIDQGQTIFSNAAKEAREEAGLQVVPEHIIALQEHNLHNAHPKPWGIIKCFVLCRNLGGEFRDNDETLGRAFFARDQIPPMNDSKTTRAQVEMCFAALDAGDAWQPIVD